MGTSSYSCILWDVDGTIADASRGILPRLVEVLGSYGMSAPAVEELRFWIGPPLAESFRMRGGMSAEQANEAVTRYRELAARDGYAASVDLYPGVPELVREVASLGVPQATASTKPENQVAAILEHYDLIGLFTAVAGAQPGPDGRGETKSHVVQRALSRLAAAGVDTSNPVLIGDRHHDVEGGAEHGVPVIFVDWGFGEPAEALGAIHRVATVDELRALLLQ